MLVQDMMQHTVISAPPDTSLAEALDLMQEHRIRHLPVVSGQQMIGMLTDRDCRQAMPSSSSTLSLEEIIAKLDTVAIETCMTAPVVTVPPQSDSVETARQLLDGKFDCLPVVQQHELVGIVTATDFLRAFLSTSASVNPDVSVSDYMQTDPLTVAPTDIVRTAYHRMRCAHIRHLPVVATGRRLVGLLTDRDVRHLQASAIPALTTYELREPTYTLTVQEVMTLHVATVGEHTPMAEAGERLLSHRFGCLPVVSAHDTLEGIVTVRDLIRGYIHT